MVLASLNFKHKMMEHGLFMMLLIEDICVLQQQIVII